MTDQGIDQARITVLISGHLPPPIGGMGTYYQTLLSSSLPKYVYLHFIQTSSQKRELSNSGTATLSNLISAFKDCVRFTRALLKTRPQIAHIGTAFGLSFIKHSYCVFISRLLGCRVLLHPHCSVSMLYTDKSRAWQWYFRQVIRSTHGLIVLSQEWLQLSEAIPGCRIHYLPNSVNLSTYQTALDTRLSRQSTGQPLNILYLGYLGAAKGSFVILDAASKIQAENAKMNFYLVGSELTPGELNLLKEKVDQNHLEQVVKLLPPVIGDEKITLFQNADIFIYPSFHEGVPMAVLEAMASGLPIVATRVGGLPDVIQDGKNGLLIDAGQPQQLAEALLKLHRDDSLRKSMQTASIQIVRDRFSMDQHVTNLVNIYRQVIKGTKEA